MVMFEVGPALNKGLKQVISTGPLLPKLFHNCKNNFWFYS